MFRKENIKLVEEVDNEDDGHINQGVQLKHMNWLKLVPVLFEQCHNEIDKDDCYRRGYQEAINVIFVSIVWDEMNQNGTIFST